MHIPGYGEVKTAVVLCALLHRADSPSPFLLLFCFFSFLCSSSLCFLFLMLPSTSAFVLFFFLLSFSSFSFPPPLLDPSSGFYSQRIRALWHAYGNGRVRHAPLKQLRYLCKNASLSLYFQPFLSF